MSEKHFRRLKERQEIEEKASDKKLHPCKNKLFHIMAGSTTEDMLNCSDCDGYGIIYLGPEDLDNIADLSEYFDFCGNYESSEKMTPDEVVSLNLIGIQIEESGQPTLFHRRDEKNKHISYSSIQDGIDEEKINPYRIGSLGRTLRTRNLGHNFEYNLVHDD